MQERSGWRRAGREPGPRLERPRQISINRGKAITRAPRDIPLGNHGESAMDRSERLQKEFLSYVKKEAIDMPDIGVIDAKEPNLYKDIFPWTMAPTMPMDGVLPPLD